MINKEELLAKVNQFLETDMTYKSYEETIVHLVGKVEQQQNELKEARCREISYIDDIEQTEGMFTQANGRIKEMKEKCRFKFVEKVMEENLALAQEVARLKGVVPV
jgi:phosphoribosylaminoimidazole-succinocarboxamide synthase